MRSAGGTISDLRFRIRILEQKVRSFESGEKYVRMKEEFRKTHAAELRTIARLEKELSDAHAETIRVRELWYATCLDIEQACQKKLEQKDREIARLEKALLKAQTKQNEGREKLRAKTREYYEVAGQLEEEKEKNAALTARINKDYHNSSKPSSADPNHAVIHNSREKSGRKPGGQPGHVHYERKKQKPTDTIHIPTPDKYTKDSTYKRTGREIHKQLVCLELSAKVIDFVADEYRNQITGQRVHAEFPYGLVDDVTYDGSVKAMAYLINNGLYTSVDKTRVFLKEVSHGAIDLSNGFICGLSKEFSKKTEVERNKIFLDLVASPLMHADFTFGRVNGKQGAVMICTSGDKVLYQGRKKKGDEGVKGTPVEYYDGTLVSDHEAALIKHGRRNQECLVHVSRYARGSAENEPGLQWNHMLVDWINRSLDYWKNIHMEKVPYSREQAESYITELEEILVKAGEEYEYEPPSKYYREGYNLYKRMSEDTERYVLFLRDPSVPPSNNVAERYGRKFKRKAHQVMSFRSNKGFDYFCDGLTIAESMRARKENVYDSIASRFNQK